MHLLRLRVTQKALRLPRFLFCSKVSRLQVFLYGLAKFCCACFMDCYPGRVWPVPKTFHCTYWKMFAQQTFSESQISWMRAWHAMCFRENNNGGSKRAHTVTDILRFRDPVFWDKITIFAGTLISLLQQCLWPPNLARWWLTLRGY